MEPFSHYRIQPTKDGYEVILFINERKTETSAELGVQTTYQVKAKSLEQEAIDYTNKHLQNLKIKAIKIVAGTLLITSFGFINLTPKAEASATNNIQHSVNRTYTVVSGDTLSQIAARFETTVQSIRTSNQLTSDLIRVGQTLVIPTSASSTITQQTNYVVVSGDSLFRIANRFGTTVDAIRQVNQLTTDFLRVGQHLIIPNKTTQTQQRVSQPNYTIVSGDSLFSIAQRFGTTVDAIRNSNNLTSDLLRLGQQLVIPTNSQEMVTQAPTQQTTTYTVVSGDTLSHIAARFGTTVDLIRRANNLSTDLLRIGQTLTIPSNGEVRTTPSTTQVQAPINQAELDLLAKIIFAEARGESLEGQIAVAAVILNRVRSPLFPNNVRDVIYERTNGHFQFSPAGNGSLDQATPNSSNYEAARRALAGEDPTRGSLYFYNPSKTGDTWLRTRTVSTTIGNHVFAY